MADVGGWVEMADRRSAVLWYRPAAGEGVCLGGWCGERREEALKLFKVREEGVLFRSLVMRVWWVK